MKSNVPNFLIAGMAKCGTTSLANYINQHPDIYISSKKEPRFITSACGKFPENGPKDHLVKQWYVQDFEAYQKLFEGRQEKCLGEASADTLYFYRDTIPVIKKYLGTPKIIAIIRDPFNRAFSAYKHLVRDEREFLPFHEALQKEEERIRNNWELIYHYTQASQYYDCIKAFKEKFPEVLVLLNEDLKNDPQGTFKRIFNFLEVDSTYQVTDVKQLNKSGKPKSQVLHYGLNGKGMISKIGKPLLRLLVPQADKRAAVRVAIKNWNLKDIKSSNEEEERLRQYFAEDVLKTGDLIQRDLGHWISK